MTFRPDPSCGKLHFQQPGPAAPCEPERWETSPQGAESWETSPPESERWETSPPGSDLGGMRVLVFEDELSSRADRAGQARVRELLAEAGARVVVVGGGPGGPGGPVGLTGPGGLAAEFKLLANKLVVPPALDPAPAPGRTGVGLPARKGPTGRGKTSHKQHARAAKRRRS